MIENTPKLLHKEITHAIIGAGMDVHNALGPGWDEMDYHLAMLKALDERGLEAESHLRGNLMHQGQQVDRFVLDIIVENKVILELKHIQTNFAPEHYAQLINYLKFWRKDLGMLINFGLDQLRFKRVPYSPNDGLLATVGRWDEFVEVKPELADRIFQACSLLLDQYGLGYGVTASQRLLEAVCVASGFDVQVPVACLKYNDTVLGSRAIGGFVIDSDCVMKVSALTDRTTASDMARLVSYMRKLNIRYGALVNFGRHELCIRGVINQKKSNLH